MRVVVDASVMITANRVGPAAEQARSEISNNALLAPHSLGVEVVQGFRRLVSSGECSEAVARRAIWNVNRLHIDRLPFETFAARVWELRHNVTAHDAWYVAIAERFGVPLVTTDRRLANATGPTCEFVVL
jgi:predicted nucleic acid-binding protein